MPLTIVLSRPRRRHIERLDRKTKDPDQRVRCRVVLKVATGVSSHRAALEVGCVPSTAWRIVTRFLEEGESALFDRRESNGGHKVTEEATAALLVFLAQTPQAYGFARPTWTLEILQIVLREQTGVELSRGHLGKVLHRLGVRWKRARPALQCPWDPERWRARVRRIRALAAAPPPGEVVVFADEVDLHLNPKIGPDWMLRGEQREILTPGKNQKAYAAGAYDPIRERFVYVEGDQKASWLFLNLVRALLEVYGRARKIHVILDNFGIHKSAAVIAAMLTWAGPRIRLHFLPPYSPQENRIERIWEDVHANVTRNHRCSTLAEVLEQVRQYLAARFDFHVGFCPVSW